MASIYTPKRCLQKLEIEYGKVFDIKPTPYQVTRNCVDCDGEVSAEHPCHITLDKLLRKIEELENGKTEVRWI